MFQVHISARTVERNARQRRPHLEASETGSLGGSFTSVENKSTDSASRPIGMDEESTNLCSVIQRIEQHVMTAGPMITAVESLAFAPSSAANNREALRSAAQGRGGERGSIGVQLA